MYGGGGLPGATKESLSLGFDGGETDPLKCLLGFEVTPPETPFSFLQKLSIPFGVW